MMKQPSASITDLPVSPEADRKRRMTVYLILMGIRLACLFVFIAVPDWWKLVPALGAIFIPYFAVTLANATGSLGTKSDHVVQRGIEQGPS